MCSRLANGSCHACSCAGCWSAISRVTTPKTRSPEMARGRASEEVVLSYARFDEKGNETLPSFFLHDAPFAMCDARIRPAASRALLSRASSSIQDENLLEKLARSHRRL